MSRTKNYIGLATSFHDPAIAILSEDGDVVFAEGAERYLQNKRAIGCAPDHVVRIIELIESYCDPDGTFIVSSSWSRKMHLLLRGGFAIGLINRERILSPKGDRLSRFHLSKFLMSWIEHSQWLQGIGAGSNLAYRLRENFNTRDIQLRRYSHHDTHAVYACASSPFQDAVCVVVDGYGEMSSLAFYHYADGEVRLIKKNRGAASLGFYYKELTRLCGFDFIKGEEWKVMGLAPYGKVDDEIHGLLRSWFEVDGLDLKQGPREAVADSLARLNRLARPPDAPLIESADLAFTGQQVFSEVMEELLNNLHKEGLSENLIVTGGCGLNSSFNGAILKRTPFEHLHVPSAPGDDGNAIGAGLRAMLEDHPDRPLPKTADSPYLGSRISEQSMRNLERFGGIKNLRHLPGTVHEEAAALLAEGKIIGWFQGQAEFGPRALGNRSIFADPRPAEMKDKINESVKFREAYRPFAPCVLHEFGPEYFEDYQESRYMERTLKVKADLAGRIPAVVHVDGSARLQTVKQEWNERLYQLLKAFHERTGVPVILNTSFNVMGKPIVHSVEDAVATFFTTGLSAIVLGDYLIEK
ncbi:MAG: carbamoyltransferase family protein [Methyloligellaceae bacterium]